MIGYALYVLPEGKRVSPEIERFFFGTVDEVSFTSDRHGQQRYTIDVTQFSPRRFIALDEEFAARLAEEIAATVPGAAGW